jgi:hypothetical protein
MKRLFLILAFLVISTVAYADTFIIYKTDTKDIYSISNEDDAIMPASGYTKVITKQRFEDIQFQYPMDYYRYENGKFIVNADKVRAEVNAQIAAQERANEEKLIQDKLRAQAIDELKKEGKTFKYIEEAK